MSLMKKWLYSLNKKKKVVKHCLAWNMKKSSPNAKSFYNMLIEQFKFMFNFSSEYFKAYETTNDDIRKILTKNLANNKILEELKSTFMSHSYKKKNSYNYTDSDDISIDIDTVEHMDMVKKSNQYQDDLVEKKKMALDKLLED